MLHKKHSTEFKKILLDLDEEDKYESYHDKSERRWNRTLNPFISQLCGRKRVLFDSRNSHKRVLTDSSPGSSNLWEKLTSKSIRQTPRFSKPTFELARVSIGKPELPTKLKNLRTLPNSTPSSRNRIKIVI